MSFTVKRVVSAAEANREFAKVLRAVKQGARVTVTSHGEPVAELIPSEPKKSEAERKEDEMFRAFLDDLSRRPAQNLPRATRDDMYD